MKKTKAKEENRQCVCDGYNVRASNKASFCRDPDRRRCQVGNTFGNSSCNLKISMPDMFKQQQGGGGGSSGVKWVRAEAVEGGTAREAIEPGHAGLLKSVVFPF